MCVCVCVLQDEQSAMVMVKKHQILEQALEDYAQTIHQLANSSRLMVTSEHPERSEVTEGSTRAESPIPNV